MSQQMELFDSYQFEDSHSLVCTAADVLDRRGFSQLLSLGTSREGHVAYRAIFEDKPCTVQIDKEGHIMFKHDDSRFYDYGGEV